MNINYELLERYGEANKDSRGEMVMATVRNAIEVIEQRESYTTPSSAIFVVCLRNHLGYWDTKRQLRAVGLPPPLRDVAIQIIRSVLGEDMYE